MHANISSHARATAHPYAPCCSNLMHVARMHAPTKSSPVSNPCCVLCCRCPQPTVASWHALRPLMSLPCTNWRRTGVWRWRGVALLLCGCIPAKPASLMCTLHPASTASIPEACTGSQIPQLATPCCLVLPHAVVATLCCAATASAVQWPSCARCACCVSSRNGPRRACGASRLPAQPLGTAHWRSWWKRLGGRRFSRPSSCQVGVKGRRGFVQGKQSAVP